MIVAEISASHNGSLEKAKELISLAAWSGATAVKLQTFTADDMTIKGAHKISNGPWAGKDLHQLYQQAHTPLKWHKELFDYAARVGLVCFSSPFSVEAVDFLENLDCPIYKIASFEMNDKRLIERCAATGKPIIISTGMATGTEIKTAAFNARGASDITLLHCVSAYPTPVDQANLLRINKLKMFGYPVGFSDHTLSLTLPSIAIALGATVIEKHIKMPDDKESPDASFALEPHQFKIMVDTIKETRAALQVVVSKEPYTMLRRSLYAVADIKAGERFTEKNVKSIRPGLGLPPSELDEVLASKAAQKIKRGTPLSETMLCK